MVKKVITYGTYDLLHEGHINLLRRAKELGDYLIVGVTSDRFDRERGKLNVRNNVLERVESVRKTGFADEIIIEDYVGQKIDDIQKYEADIFAVGSDWEGKFDYLNEFCKVVYLPRTEGVSSTMLREESQQIIRVGMIGTGRIADRFIPEAECVSGVKIVTAYNPNLSESERFVKKNKLERVAKSLDDLLSITDAVYIASPHLTHYQYIKKALETNHHVLCEIPMVLKEKEALELYKMAGQRNLVLLEASKTAFCPAFNHVVNLVKSGIIGEVVDVRASLSKLVTANRELRELKEKEAGGCMTELSPFPLLSVVKLLGKNISDMHFYSKIENGVDIFTKGIINYDNAVSAITLGLGVKTEGNLVISGTKGYVYVPSPWWLTSFFEIRYEDQTKNKKYFYPYEGEGLRYEIQEFISMILNHRLSSHKLRRRESALIARIIEYYRDGNFKKMK